MRVEYLSHHRCALPRPWLELLMAVICLCPSPNAFSQRVDVDVIAEPYRLDQGLISRSISFENPTGAPGQGGKAASTLGPGRKGSPARKIQPQEAVELCDIHGPGTIRHIWVTTSPDPNPSILRSFVLRAWYDGQDHPSMECPLGDFFGLAHGKLTAYHSAVHSISPNGGLNIYLPMPFTRRVRMALANESAQSARLYYQIDYTLRDKHPDDVGRLHVLFRRENPTAEKHDFELLPRRTQRGRFIGSLMGVRNLSLHHWWGEGEMKAYLDGDQEFPTICGSGSEDYIGMSRGVQQVTFLYSGCNFCQKEFVSMYRWHLPDPIIWEKDGRITIQQIAYKNGLIETSDDWSCATFWYEPVPSAPLPAMPDLAARTVGTWKEDHAKK